MFPAFSFPFNWSALSVTVRNHERTQRAVHISIPLQLFIALILNILSLAFPIVMLQVYDRIIPHHSYPTLIMLTVGVLVALALDATLRLIRAYMLGWSSATQEHVANCAAIDRFCNSDMDAFDKSGTGEHLQNMNAIARLREYFNGQTLIALIDLPFAGLFLGLIAYLGGYLVFVPLTLLVIFCFGAALTGQTLKKSLDAREARNDGKMNFIVSTLAAMQTIKAMGMESFMQRRFEKAQNDVTHENFNVAMASGSAVNLSSAFGQLCFILTASMGCIMVLHEQLSVGSLSACTLLAGRAIQPIQRILGTWLRLQDIGLAKQQVTSLFTLPVQERNAFLLPAVAAGRVSLKNLSYKPPGHDDYILRDISLDIEPGQVIAISGFKASGKSTLLQLIAGFLQPTSGQILVDDIQPSRINMTDLVKRVGYLPQQSTIFKGTILDNLTGFRTDPDSIMRAKMMGAELNLDQIIDLLPQGYETILNDSPADPVPPGVKQRIALTRILMHEPKILLFDEADRALDKDGYNGIFRLLGRLKKHHTIIIVSQDQNLLCFADEFYHLENGILLSNKPAKTHNLSILSRPVAEIEA